MNFKVVSIEKTFAAMRMNEIVSGDYRQSLARALEPWFWRPSSRREKRLIQGNRSGVAGREGRKEAGGPHARNGTLPVHLCGRNKASWTRWQTHNRNLLLGSGNQQARDQGDKRVSVWPSSPYVVMRWEGQDLSGVPFVRALIPSMMAAPS